MDSTNAKLANAEKEVSNSNKTALAAQVKRLEAL